MSSIKTTIIGAGHLGRIHAKLASGQDSLDVIGVVDPSAAARRQIEESLGLPTFESTADLPCQPQAAIVAAPTALHHRVVKPLLEQGTHVLVEKPITVSNEEADELVETAAAHQCVLQVGHVERFNPAFQHLRQKVKQAKFIKARRMSGYTFRSTDVGVVLDLMIHDLDLVLSLVQSPVKQVDAVGISIMGENEDIAQARLEFENGSVAQLVASRCSFSPQRTLQVFSDRAFAQADFNTRKVESICPSEAILGRAVDFLAMPSEGQQEVRESLFTDWLPRCEEVASEQNAILEEHRDFVDSIQNNHSPLVCGRQGAAALALAHQVLEEIRQHAWYGDSLPVSGPLAVPFPRIIQSGDIAPDAETPSFVPPQRKAG